jgi:nucleoside-diphosphate-sugar epimerase
MHTILVTGATGQIGSELTMALRQQYGAGHVVAASHRRPPDRELLESGPYCCLNVRDAEALQQIVRQYRINTIYHLASVLSAVAEQTSQLAWHVNMEGLNNVLEVAREAGCMDDTVARTEWGWHPRLDLATMTQEMLASLTARFATVQGTPHGTR